ncbi:MAG: bifunctional nuclease family protein [Treponema sp.]|nr:bifunctional nuclease family protein [Treponema sp.]
MAAETFVEADIWTVAQTDQGNVVLVRPKGSDLAVPIFIGQLETQAILIGLGGVEVPRPLTHDLLLSVIESLGAQLDRIEINGLKEGTFYARLVILRDAVSLSIDARPSDAIGMAVRSKCPVFIAESVVDEAGISVNLVTEGGTVRPGATGNDSGAIDADPLRADAQRLLQSDLEKAIEAEDYEKAAEIRDKLKGLGG